MIKLGSKTITRISSPYIIAEIGVNHEGSLSKAFELIHAAKESGADAAKFQTYKAEKLASVNSPSYWDLNMEPTTSQFELFKKYDSFSVDDYFKCYEECNKQGIDFLSTPFDFDAVDFLNPLMPFFKIASADITNLPFLKYIASFGKPVVFSTGASTISEINNALSTLKNNGCDSIVPLHCVLSYPTAHSDANLNMINFLLDSYPDLIIGYSDHTLADSDMNILSAAYLKGARVIEKHFSLDKSIPGGDHLHSMDPSDLKLFIDKLSFFDDISGSYERHVLECEKLSRLNARRSICVSKAITAGDIFSTENLTIKRPGHGLSPEFFDSVIGKASTVDLAIDDLLYEKHVDGVILK